MEVNEIAIDECKTILQRGSMGRLGCSYQDQPYVVPIHFACEHTYLYAFSTFGQKVKWMRANPKVCVQTSVIVYGKYEELPEPQYAAERKHASSLLAKRHHWWLNALGERQMRVSENSVQPLFFRIRIESMSGLRASEQTQMTCSLVIRTSAPDWDFGLHWE